MCEMTDENTKNMLAKMLCFSACMMHKIGTASRPCELAQHYFVEVN